MNAKEVYSSRRLLAQVDVARLLGPQVLRDAVATGWLKPCAIKRGKTAYRPAKVLYAMADVARVEERILAGEYPQAPPEAEPV